MNAPPPTIRIGHGYDIHRLEPPEKGGKRMILGGVPLDHASGPVGHSDGDALLHALTDAILGAIGTADIGGLFPNTDEANRDRDSLEFLNEALRRMRGAGYELGNVDCTVILERPKIGPHRDSIIERLAGALGVEPSRVNVKGKTHESVDAVGEGRAVKVHVVALLFAGGA